MNAPTFQEAHISQIPAIRFLQQLGYNYVSPEEAAVERRGKLRHVLLEGVLAKQLRRLNKITFKGQTVPFSGENIAKAIESLREISQSDGLVRVSEKVYDLLTLGKSLDQTVAGETKGFTLRYVDWENPFNNSFHVTAEFEVERSGSRDTRRPDIVCFVNGIPFIVIECKRPDDKDAILSAIKQTLRNQQDDEIPGLFIYSQLLLALSKNAGSYGTVGTPVKFWARWKETRDVSTEIRAAINSKVPVSEHEKLFKGVFAYAKDEFEGLLLNPREATQQDHLLWSVCRPDRLIELARQFIVYDEGGAVKKIARYQQYFAVRKTLERVRQRDAEGKRKGGVIWHTQGSGKSLTMVMLGKALALESSIENPRIVLVTDRIDLDEQIWKTFHQCGKDPQQAKTGKHLQELLADDRVGVITTVLDKFGAAANASGDFKNENGNLFVLVDESHRSQYGEANIRMMKALPNACFIGFTGTPLMKKEKNTAKKFGGIIEPPYTIRDAVADEAVVPLLYEGRHIMQDVNQKAVDRMFEAMSAGLTPQQRADLKRKFTSRDELNRLESRLYLIAWDVSQHYSQNWKGTGFKAQLTASGKKEALILKRFLDQFGKVTSEVIISAPDDREGDEENTIDESVLKFWKVMILKYGSEKEYNRQIINSFKKADDPEILIVVDKLLTGFDAPLNTVLYIARKLKEHTLLQAIARVNRLHPGKDFGYIIDYYGVLTQLHDALELYSSLEGKFDEEDLAGTLADLAQELKKLPGLHDALWDIFKDVPNKKDEEAFELALEDPKRREDFYARLSKFSRILKAGLSSLNWINATPENTVARYKQDVAFFQRLRASVKIRYAEEIDYRDYEQQIQKMLNTYVQADEIIQVIDPVNIFEREKFEQQVEMARTPRAKADIIANRTKKTLTEKMDEDPFFYRPLSDLLEQTIDEYRKERIDEAKYLAKVKEIMEKVRDAKRDNTPPILKEHDLANAFFGAIRDAIPAESLPISDDLAARMALKIEGIIRENAVVRWRDNDDAQNRMRNGIDDYLFELQEKHGITLSIPQMDSILESAIRIAKNRPQDV
ncbi:MAG: type I restriction endonuclease subunit R [Chthoniobacteraceae bacterium]